MTDFCFIGTIFENGLEDKQFFAYFNFEERHQRFLEQIVSDDYKVVTVAPMHDITNRYDVTNITWVEDNEYLITYDQASPLEEVIVMDRAEVLAQVPLTDDVCLSARVCKEYLCTTSKTMSRTVLHW